MAFGFAMTDTHPLQANLEAVCLAAARASAPVARLCLDLRRRFIKKTPEFLFRSTQAVSARISPGHRTQETFLELTAPRIWLRLRFQSVLMLYAPMIVDLPPSCISHIPPTVWEGHSQKHAAVFQKSEPSVKNQQFSSA